MECGEVTKDSRQNAGGMRVGTVGPVLEIGYCHGGRTCTRLVLTGTPTRRFVPRYPTVQLILLRINLHEKSRKARQHRHACSALSAQA
jgi:hypothetical protein